MCNRKTACFTYLFYISIIIPGLCWCTVVHAQETTSDSGLATSSSTLQKDSNKIEGKSATPGAEDDICTGESCDPEAKPPSRILTLVDRAHAGISNRLEATVKYADHFFATDNVFEETNKSYARLPLDTIYDQDNGLEFKVRVRARIILPNTNKKLKLLFSDTGTIDDPEANPSNSSTVRSAVRDNDYAVSLETEFEKTGKWKIRPALGVKSRIPPDPFVRIRAIRYLPLSKKWLSRLSATSAYLAIDGFAHDANVQLSRAIQRNFLFRSSSRWKFTEEKDYSEAIQIFSLFQHLNEKVNLAYEAGIFSDNEDNWEVAEYRLWHRYRKLVYKKWLFLELIPELRFKQENDYDPSYRITFRIEPVFGKKLPIARIHRVD